MTLYLDMDGVLMDFDGHVAKWGCRWAGAPYHHLPEDQWTEEQKENDLKYKAAMADHSFWYTMRPTNDARLLWDFCRDYIPHILTATPNAVPYRGRCANDKLSSIRAHFDYTFPAVRFHACLRSEKKYFAKSSADILVDDLEPNCAEWNAAGGTAILHKDALSTIKVLREIFYA